VFNNEDLNQVTWEQRIINTDPKFEASQRIPSVSYSRFADMIGLRGIYVDAPAMLGSAWEQALASDIPVVLEVKTDPEVPPLPAAYHAGAGQEFLDRARQGGRQYALAARRRCRYRNVDDDLRL
jgi:thiamine pyrophosphate-dependent acetolactate synthase large subunit-like protein